MPARRNAHAAQLLVRSGILFLFFQRRGPMCFSRGRTNYFQVNGPKCNRGDFLLLVRGLGGRYEIFRREDVFFFLFLDFFVFCLLFFFFFFFFFFFLFFFLYLFNAARQSKKQKWTVARLTGACSS